MGDDNDDDNDDDNTEDNKYGSDALSIDGTGHDNCRIYTLTIMHSHQVSIHKSTNSSS